MELIFFCRITADLCLYFAYASFLLPYFTEAQVDMVPMLIISAAALAAFFLRKKLALSIGVMIAAGVLLYLLKIPQPFIAVLPPWIYAGYIVFKGYFGATYLQQRDTLKRSCFLFAGFLRPAGKL